MTNQSKNPIFWSVLAFLVGIGLLIWGVNKNDSNHYVGSNTIIAAAIVCIVGGGIGMFTFGNRKK